ncbi:YadA family autotransporter adhesin, partial [Brachymonas sp. M4Q-1]|uniref:YadA family autotransporter adhesin n=1 Tax=Brachymonas sp. M4Q-1 TaxID=3416906 RepID=UPI003CF7DE13
SVTSTSTDAINGSQLYATNQAVTQLQNGGAGPVQYANSGSTTSNGGTPTNTLTLVGADSSSPVTLTNVAPGEVSSTSTQAVNGAQLYQTNQAVNTLGNQVSALGNQIGNVDRNASAGTASAMASAGLPQAYLPGKSMAAVAGATYRGQSAMAVGVSTITDNGKWVFKGSLNSNTRGYVGATIGAGFQW